MEGKGTAARRPWRVFTFGSVPLKTYLPDGDIDLTAFSKDENLKDTWTKEVREVLENEEKNENAEFHVKEVQYIQAEVKIIKCLVEDIVVDISFNQLGGLCTLCFLEQIDHIINHDHLFKRSIILIKAWCYYESRILGAHHGLISTYALETLVLYIFHVFNNSFAGPLEVLCRFLEFFSNFDWDNFCVSLWGPVPISSLPDMAGNFFRIRSAFAFGAKKLASLLECAKEDLIAEVNRFFMNTWERHGSGNRPDAPGPNLWHLQPSKMVRNEESNSSRITSSTERKNENVVLHATHDCQSDGAFPFYDNSSQIQQTINQHSQNIHRTSTASATSCTQNRRSFRMQNGSRVSGHIEKNNGSIEFVQAENCQKPLKPDHYVNYQGEPGRFHFARTQSSPELADTSSEVLSQGSCNKFPKTGNNLIASARLDHGSRRKYSGFNVLRSQYAKSFVDPSSSRHCSSQQSLEAADSNNVSNIYHDDVGFTNIVEEHSSVSEALEMHQEQQDLVNMMASSSIHNLIGQVQMPIHVGSPHLPLPLPSSLLASMGYGHINFAGSVPTSFPMTEESPQSSNMLFPQGFVSSPLFPYFLTAGFSLNSEDVVDPTNESCGMTEMNAEESDGYLHQDDPRSDQGFDPENGDFHMLHSDHKQQEILRGFNYVSSSQASNSGPSLRGHHKFARESSVVSEEHTGAFQNELDSGNDTYSSVRNGYMTGIPTSQASPSRNKSASESSSDGPAKTSRDERGRRTTSPAVLTSLYRVSKSEWQLEGSSNHSSAQADDEASPHARPHQLSGYEPAQISGSESVIPVAPMIVNGSGQRVVDNSGVVPFAFYPTGPPVPFLTMLPVYNMPPATGSSDGLINQFDKDERLDHGGINPCDQNHDSAENLDQSKSYVSSSAFRCADPEPPEEHKSDILNGDFLSYWQNLQYGRSCQNTRYHGSFLYQSPVMMPPIYLQGHFPWDGPGRPLTADANLLTHIMSYGPQVDPVTPMQPGPHRTSGVFQNFGDEIPRYRGGAGTYLPNPKVSFRDRQSSTRNHRGNCNSDRNDHADREGSWIYAKSRDANRSHGRTQVEKLGLQPDRLSTADNQIDRPWDPHRHEPLASNQAQNRSFGLANSSRSSPNLSYGMHPVPTVNSNGVGPVNPAVSPVVMLYSYDQGIRYGSYAESLEFGSLGPVHLSGMNKVASLDDVNMVRESYDQRDGRYKGSSSRSSPDQPSSPQLQR
ncbi:Nucleotidyl transferase domain [Cocos nucifera]|uniref:Nucleotidyl transferase domain n=1 Tax=Cocos nucifera TaxID=13894 RepID=A0A8K0NC93_COCNU|nr:Nucleotidyl transferase domain [Cocos nucifera]